MDNVFDPLRAGTGIPRRSEGVILQRGGAELALEKVGDRFTVRPRSAGSLSQWQSKLSATHRRTVPATQLEEFSVAPDRLDAAMAEARSLPEVAFASHVYRLAADPGMLIYLTDQLTVQFVPGTPEADMDAIAQRLHLQRSQPVPGLPSTFTFVVTPEALDNPVKLANQLTREPQVLAAEPNVIVRAQSHYRPRDPLYAKQWYLHHSGGPELVAGSHIDVERAWDLTRGDRAIVVAVADDSLDLNHPDFQGFGKIVAPRDLLEDDFLPLPATTETSHGTACAGLAVAEENGAGIVGVAPGCSLMPIRTTGYIDDDAIDQIFQWAMDHGAAVISCSWGAGAVNFPLSLRQKAMLTRAATEGRQGKGCVIVFAAGNTNRPLNGRIMEQGWPPETLKGPTDWLSGFGVHPDVIAVSASTSLSRKAFYSNWGRNISVCAPSNNAPPGIWLQRTGYIATPPVVQVEARGQGVFTTDQVGPAGYEQGNFTAYFGGTSSACPVVAGVAALVLSVNPNLSAVEVRRILQQTADKIVDPAPDPQLGTQLGTYDANGHSQWFGYGKVNAHRAVQAARKTLVTPPAGTAQIRLSDAPGYSIPDRDPWGVTSTLEVMADQRVRDLKVTVAVIHEYLGDLSLTLISPSGQSVLLQGRTLGRQTQLRQTYTLQTTPGLRSLLQQPAQGQWQLQVIDHALLNIGTLESWELVLSV